MLNILGGTDGVERDAFESIAFSQKRFRENEETVLKFISENFDGKDRKEA